jgi:hypothetical protein
MRNIHESYPDVELADWLKEMLVQMSGETYEVTS